MLGSSTSADVRRALSPNARSRVRPVSIVSLPVPPKTMSVHESGLPRIYTANNSEIAAVPGYNYIFRNIAAMHYFEGIPANSDVHVHSYWVIGSVEEIKTVAQAFCQEWGCWK